MPLSRSTPAPRQRPRHPRAPTVKLRPILVALHRWFGLAAAVFLFIAGATGAVISWDHELDGALNPALFHARSGHTDRPALPSLDLLQRIETADPRVRVTYVSLAPEPGEALLARVEPRIDPVTHKPYEVHYNQVALDPVTGEEQGRREWGKAALSRANLLPFLYKLHYSMQIPDGFGIELGVWLMGLIAMAWVLDTAVALAISFPNRAAWKRSFAFRWGAGGHRLTFDLHRSGGVWLFALIGVLAVTSVAMNLGNQVVRPLVSAFSPLSPSPFADRRPAPVDAPIEPTVSPRDAVRLAQAEATRRGWPAPPGGLFLSTMYGVYGVGFYTDDHPAGLGNPWLYLDARTGATVGADVPGTGSAGDIVMQAMSPLHSGRILGLPGRIMISAMGVAVAVFSATGVMIWARKRAARSKSGHHVRRPAAPRTNAPAAPTPARRWPGGVRTRA